MSEFQSLQKTSLMPDKYLGNGKKHTKFLVLEPVSYVKFKVPASASMRLGIAGSQNSSQMRMSGGSK